MDPCLPKTLPDNLTYRVLGILQGSPKISTSGIRVSIIVRLLGFKVILFQLYLDCFGYMNLIFLEQHILIVAKLDI